MSLETWKARYYLISATNLYFAGRELTDKQREISTLHHSLRKWKGLLASNLKRHKLRLICFNSLTGGNGRDFYIDSDSCSLCALYLRSDCINCPISKNYEKTECNMKSEAWKAWCSDNNPKPMIARLKKELKRALAEEFPNMQPMYASLPKSKTYESI